MGHHRQGRVAAQTVDGRKDPRPAQGGLSVQTPRGLEGRHLAACEIDPVPLRANQGIQNSPASGDSRLCVQFAVGRLPEYRPADQVQAQEVWAVEGRGQHRIALHDRGHVAPQRSQVTLVVVGSRCEGDLLVQGLPLHLAREEIHRADRAQLGLHQHLIPVYYRWRGHELLQQPTEHVVGALAGNERRVPEEFTAVQVVARQMELNAPAQHGGGNQQPRPAGHRRPDHTHAVGKAAGLSVPEGRWGVIPESLPAHGIEGEQAPFGNDANDLQVPVGGLVFKHARDLQGCHHDAAAGHGQDQAVLQGDGF